MELAYLKHLTDADSNQLDRTGSIECACNLSHDVKQWKQLYVYNKDRMGLNHTTLAQNELQKSAASVTKMNVPFSGAIPDKKPNYVPEKKCENSEERR